LRKSDGYSGLMASTIRPITDYQQFSKGVAMHETTYQITDKTDSHKLAEFLCQQGQFLLPMVELISGAEMAVDALIEATGRAAIEAVLTLSAQEVAGPKHPGKAAGEVTWYGRQKTTIPLSERKLRVEKPRLRRKRPGADKEVAIPAYEAMLGNSRLGRRILEILLAGVSTRNYRKILPEMAETVAVSKSALSREFIDASEQTRKDLCERRLEGQDILIVYLDGIQFGPTHVIVALGVDAQGYKHVLGLREGSSENATVVKDLRTDIVARGLQASRRRLFVIDGSKALRKAINEVFGGTKLAGGPGGDVHDQPSGAAQLLASLPGQHQCHRVVQRRDSPKDRTRDPLAGWPDGAALDDFGPGGAGEADATDHGPSAIVDAGG
jgi:hypothetical protein